MKGNVKEPAINDFQIRDNLGMTGIAEINYAPRARTKAYVGFGDIPASKAPIISMTSTAIIARFTAAKAVISAALPVFTRRKESAGLMYFLTLASPIRL